MYGYLFRRLLGTIPVMLVVAIFIFLMLRLTPSDPAAIIAGDNATTEQVAKIRDQLGLDRPIVEQFFIWSGKVLSGKNGFIVECLIRERSDEGARLQLAKIVDIPDRIGFYDDADKSIRAAEVVWRRRHQLGIRFTPELDPKDIKESDLASLARQFYAVGG